MNDRLRYRVWYKKEKRMVYAIGEISIQDQAVSIAYTDHTDDDNIKVRWLDFNEVELLQATGLNHRNGIMIWEGDVIKIPNIVELIDDEPMSFIGEVVWVIGTAQFCALNTKDEQIMDFSRFISTCQILGNKYSNPDLLQ